MDRGTYEKDIIQLDERLNIIYSVFNGTLFNIFPKSKIQLKMIRINGITHLMQCKFLKGKIK